MRGWWRLIALPLLLGAPTAQAAPGIDICYGYGCAKGATIELGDDELNRLAALFTPPAATPAEERKGIARAIAELERIAGRHTGITNRDRGGNVAGAGEEGQMDCIDESTNTTAYLQLLARQGWLRWHRVEPRRKRMRWFVAAHWSAVIADLSDKRRYVVDSWFLDNGQEPPIYPLEEWLAGNDPVSPPTLH